jgi:uncharacterized membrane protein
MGAQKTVLGSAVIASVAALNYGANLGSSSLFVDETLSWDVAAAGGREFVHRLAVHEISPPGYYILLHEWVGHVVAGANEWQLRLPSVIVGVLLALAVAWVALLIAGELAAVIAGALAASSPFLLAYAQQARAYVFVALFVTATVGAAITCGQTDARPKTVDRIVKTVPWLAAAAIWLHYTAGFIIALAAVWLWSRCRRAALALALGAGVSAVPLVPLAAAQLSNNQQSGISQAADLSLAHATAVLATPFVSPNDTISSWGVVGAAITVVTMVACVARGRYSRHGAWSLVVGCAVVPPVALLVLAGAGVNVLLPRYATVSTPFVLVAAAVFLASLRPPLRFAALAGLAAVAVNLTQTGHSRNERAPDVRGAIAAVAGGWRKTDVLLVDGYASLPYALAYDLSRELPQVSYARPLHSVGAAGWQYARYAGLRAWLVTDELSPAFLRTALGRVGYSPVERTVLPARQPLVVTLAVHRQEPR